MTDPLTALKRKILDAALARVPFEGWNRRSLTRAAVDAEGHAAAYPRAFPNGVGEAVDFFLSECDRWMLEALAEHDLSTLKIRERITLIIRTRLEVLDAQKEAVRRAFAFLMLPQNAAESVKLAWRTADLMWREAGDTASDFSHYTKRLTLSKVYATTLIFWLNDDSPGYQDSWDFLDRRIENVMQFGKLQSKVEAEIKRFTAPFMPSTTKR